MPSDHDISPAAISLCASADRARHRTLTIGALGVVFGDIGTSPLYAFRQCFTAPHGVALTEANVMGVLSLIFWSLMIVISLKYVTIMLRADNRGEGGVLALSTLVSNSTRNWKLWRPIALIGVLGAALFFGDGMLTPAISVLSAVEGLAVAAPRLQAWVIPATIGILAALFLAQKSGTEKVGRIFGPVIIIWFASLGVLGLRQIALHPVVLLALNPLYAIEFFLANGVQGFIALSAVFLVVTGGEALYADVGHFGRRPIRDAWSSIVLPALTLNYLGQGALVLENAQFIRNPFYLLAPDWALAPLIVLATAATIIASQAVISGVFSVTSQAMNLGYLPRIRIVHSSAAAMGQIYVPAANWIVFVGTLLLVLGFRSSDALASAYGVAVSATMLLAGLLVIQLRLAQPSSHRIAWLTVFIFISAVDTAFFCSNILRAAEGGWVPVTTALLIYGLMATWNEGRRQINWSMAIKQTSLEEFVHSLQINAPQRVLGTAVYLTNESTSIPRALTQQLAFQRVLHERVIILTFARAEVPRIPTQERVRIEALAAGLYRVTARYGFMERPDTLSILRLADRAGLPFEPNSTSYVVGRTTPVVSNKKGLALWRKRLYALLARNTRVGYEYFGIPTHRLIEIGMQAEL
ncbi:MAG TPA: potassium transporter Kup [Steroidobacteraceae bacterium]|nr:potassium transporter Kup [Steroidobacteraceae bacterium]